MAVGVDRDLLQVGGLLAGQRIEFVHVFDFVAEQGDAPGAIFIMTGEDIDDFATQPERTTRECGVVAAVLQIHQGLGQSVAIDPAADFQLRNHLGVGFDRTDTVDAGDRCDDDDIIALQQRLGGGMAHTVDLFVDLRVFFYVGVGARNIGFRLVVVVVADEILDGIVGKEAFHFAVKLRRQRLVRRQDQGRFLHRLDHLGHGEGLARSGHTEQDLVALRRVDATHQFRDRGRLIARGFVFGHDFQRPRHRLGRLFLRHEQHRRRAKKGLGHKANSSTRYKWRVEARSVEGLFIGLVELRQHHAPYGPRRPLNIEQQRPHAGEPDPGPLPPQVHQQGRRAGAIPVPAARGLCGAVPAMGNVRGSRTGVGTRSKIST